MYLRSQPRNANPNSRRHHSLGIWPTWKSLSNAEEAKGGFSVLLGYQRTCPRRSNHTVELANKTASLPDDEIDVLLEQVSEIKHLLFCRLSLSVLVCYQPQSKLRALKIS